MNKDWITGLTVDSRAIGWCVLQRGRAGWTRSDAGVVPIPPAEADGDAAVPLAATLKTLAPRLKGMVTLGLPSDQVLLRVLRLPAVDPVELAGMIEWQAEKLSPFPLDAMVAGHEILHIGTEASLVLVGAVKTERVDALGTALRAAGLDPRRVDVGILGWIRALRETGRFPDSGSAAHLAMTDPPQLVVVRDGVPLALRVLPLPPGTAAEPAEVARELRFTLMALELDFGALLDPVLTVWVGANAFEAEPWREAVAAAVGGTVRWERMDDPSPVAEGLARRAADAGAMDLTPTSWRLARDTAALKRRVWRAASAVLGVWVLVVSVFMGLLSLEKRKLQLVQAEREQVRRPALDVRDTRRRVFMVQRYLDHSDSAIECLRILSEQLPAEIELTSFSYRKGEECQISGESATVAAVYEFKTRIDREPLFAEGVLRGPRTLQNGRETFDLVMKLKPGESS